jgi:hypothetical protein
VKVEGNLLGDFLSSRAMLLVEKSVEIEKKTR